MFLLIDNQMIHSVSIIILNNKKEAVKNHENILLMGDLNVNALTQTKSNYTANYLIDCNLVNFSKLSKQNCTNSVCGSSSLDIMVTSKPEDFYNDSAIRTSLGDCEKL